MDVVITTIAPPTKGAAAIARRLARCNGRMWVVGDRVGPRTYRLPNTRFYDLSSQRKLPFALARLLPERHYTRKNLGYLLAIQGGAPFLVETDDDNVPLPGFWRPRTPRLTARRVARRGWFNAYRAFTRQRIWPRGFPLEEIEAAFAGQAIGDAAECECFIQQDLANHNPDVDAIFRLTQPLPVEFQPGPPVCLSQGCWCPFNSQNTTFFPPAYPLLYLPSGCTFRMTDIWRAFVAQRCLWEMNSRLCFRAATMRQDRNPHDLLRDFTDELPGYLNNRRLCQVLEKLDLRRGRQFAAIQDNLASCYEALVRANFLPATELKLVRAWNADLASL